MKLLPIKTSIHSWFAFIPLKITPCNFWSIVANQSTINCIKPYQISIEIGTHSTTMGLSWSPFDYKRHVFILKFLIILLALNPHLQYFLVFSIYTNGTVTHGTQDYTQKWTICTVTTIVIISYFFNHYCWGDQGYW